MLTATHFIVKGHFMLYFSGSNTYTFNWYVATLIFLNSLNVLLISTQENPVALLEALSMMKSHYKMLCMQLEKVSMEQRASMKGIRAAVENTMKMVQALQQHTDLEVVFSF